MKKYLIAASVCATVFSSLFFSCKDSSGKNNTAITEIVSKIEQNKYKIGDKIDIPLTNLEGITKVVVSVDGQEVPADFTIDGKAISLGNHTVNLRFFKGEEETNSRDFTFVVYANEPAAQWSYEIVGTYPHNNDYFTQGFYFKNGNIFEGTGLRDGKTRLIEYKLGATEPTKLYQIKDDVFGEGITELNGFIYQLTWQDRVIYKYDLNFNQVQKFDMPAQIIEGWGITTIGKELAVTEGSQRIHFFDENFNYLRTVQAFDSQQPYSYLNEIEYHDGLIYANVYLKSGHSDNSNIVVIDPKTGAVKAEFNFAELKGKQGNPQAQELNGIAFKDNGNMLLTGKLWDKIFEIKIKK
ncbi:glutaminyl-peptide cyclotransferase [Empedobacter tilapiae]|uniref:Glutaminyl-peptide cyclotransferase n=1 Tax=Empedobacter tilapiae TaxID=2491114 RepID=A0A4Z1BG77_9FLAO|nr:glutaminyl-peptide cyclotransferase [Empedobacter tilapiae]TGN29198.1 glutaminyl-peptide cyclotransferase [Empedobacter tilapiae]